MNKVQNILTELTDLNGAELAQVLMAAKMFAGTNAEAAATPDSNAVVQFVWTTVCKYGKKRGLNLLHPGIVERNRFYNKVIAGCTAVNEFLIEFKPRNKVERSSALDLCVQSVFSWMDKRCPHVPISVKTMAEQMIHVSQAVDMELPGYARANMLPVALRGLSGVN